MRHYTVVLTPVEHQDGSGVVYSVSVPALPSAFTWGESIGHALEMAREAIELTLEDMWDIGETLPESDAAAPTGVDLHYVYTLHFHDPAEKAVGAAVAV